MFGTLIALGLWQLERGAWKEALIADRVAAVTADPRPLGDDAAKGALLGPVRVEARGSFRHDREIHVIAPPRQGRTGYHVLTPLALADSDRWILVDRGFVPASRKEALSRPGGQVEGPTTVIGLAQVPPRKRSFNVNNDPAKNEWTWVDLGSISVAVGHPLLPVMLTAEPVSLPGGLPEAPPSIVDRWGPHVGYALTWFGIAAALLVIYILFHMRRVRT